MTAARPQRVDGCARLSVARGPDGGSRIARLYQRAPSRMLFPAAPAGAPPSAVVLTTSGGLTGGDRLEVAIGAGRDAMVIAASQAAEKIYRSEGSDCEIRIRLAAEEGASLEWLMQETILFDGARLRRSTEAEVAPSARLLAVESLVFGRIASGERFACGRLHDSWRVRRKGRLVWVDALALDDPREDRARPFGLGDAAGTATILLVAPDVDARREAVRDEIARAGVPGGASCFDGLMVVRMLASTADALRAAVIAVTTVLRGEAMPRVELLMDLMPREKDKLLVAMAALVARRRLERGVKLNHPEAIALITDAVVEGARDGRSVAQLMEEGAYVVTRDQVMPGIAEMIHDVQVEATFPDGTKLVTVHAPIRDAR